PGGDGAVRSVAEQRGETLPGPQGLCPAWPRRAGAALPGGAVSVRAAVCLRAVPGDHPGPELRGFPAGPHRLGRRLVHVPGHLVVPGDLGGLPDRVPVALGALRGYALRFRRRRRRRGAAGARLSAYETLRTSVAAGGSPVPSRACGAMNGMGLPVRLSTSTECRSPWANRCRSPHCRSATTSGNRCSPLALSTYSW